MEQVSEHLENLRRGHELTQILAKSRYKRYQHSVFVCLERPSKKLHYLYHLMNWCLITGSILLSILVTMESYDNDPFFHKVSYYYDVVLLTWISTEYAFRVWSIGWKGGWRSRWMLIKSLYMCMDAVIIIITSITYMIDVERSFVVFLRASRLIQVFRFIRIGGRKSDITIMRDIIRKHSREMLTCYFFAFMLLFSCAYVVYIFEAEADAEDRNIRDMLDGLYWGFITVTSVGYGDRSPTTPGGKAAAGLLAVAGVVFFGLPAGILGSGFAIRVAKMKTNKNWLKLRNPAATLIQTAWRNHTLKRNLRSQYTATFSKLLPLISGLGKDLPDYYKVFPGVNAICNSKHFNAFNVDLPLPEGRRGLILSSMRTFTLDNDFLKKGRRRRTMKCISLPSGLRRKSRSIVIDKQKKQLEATGAQPRYNAAIRFIMRVKYWACLKKFRRERYPFVEIKDIRDKNVQWHMEMVLLLKKIKERVTLQRMELKRMKAATVETLYTDISQVGRPNAHTI